MEQNRHISSYDIAEELDVDHKTVLRHLRKSAYKKKHDTFNSWLRVMKKGWLTIRMCEKGHGRSKDKTFNKVILCVWWCWNGIVHYELLPSGEIRYRLWPLLSATDELKKSYWEKPELVNRKGLVFYPDNTRPHSSLGSQEKLRELGWDVLMHHPYSPDFHRFRSLQNSLGSIKLTSKEHWTLPYFFNQKSPNFYRIWIMALTIRWQQVINQNSIYIL